MNENLDVRAGVNVRLLDGHGHFLAFCGFSDDRPRDVVRHVLLAGVPKHVRQAVRQDKHRTLAVLDGVLRSVLGSREDVRDRKRVLAEAAEYLNSNSQQYKQQA